MANPKHGFDGYWNGIAWRISQADSLEFFIVRKRRINIGHRGLPHKTDGYALVKQNYSHSKMKMGKP